MKYASEYQPADRFVVINDNDNDLVAIKIPLPRAPAPNKIHGYGLPAKEQMWEPFPLPERLIELQNDEDSFETLEEIHDFLIENQFDFAEEIEFINTEWERRERGFWFYNNGKPTFITGTNYLWLQAWYLDTGELPQYRNRDRKWFIAVKHFQMDPFTLGVNFPKHRREGATSRTSCLHYDVISQGKGLHGGIQSMTEKHAEEGVFQKHVVQGWKKMPFYWQPIQQGTTDPKKRLLFFDPGKRIGKKATRVIVGNALNSVIDCKPSDVGAYDTFKLAFYHGDEVGKSTKVDVFKRHNVVKNCCTLGAGKIIVGFVVLTSTVGEMDKGGGKNFQKIANLSYHNKRNKNGQTDSGLVNIFMPAFEGLEGFVDKYGNSVIDDPTPEQAKELDITIGSKDWIRQTREALRARAEAGEDGAQEALNEYTRQYPITFRECWRGAIRDCNFNQLKLEDRLEDFQFGNNKKVKGDFKWKDGIPDTKVIWVENAKTGRFWCSEVLKLEETNRYHTDHNLKEPANVHRFIAGGDPFKFKRTKTTKNSKGGGAVFMKRDVMVDIDRRDLEDWTTNRFCCTYENRPPSKNEFGEDMLMMCIYYGCHMNSENNIAFLWDYFEDRGYAGYLYYRVDPKTMKYAATPGGYTNPAMQEAIFREYQAHIENHCGREVHDEILQQCLDIEDDMGPFDVFTAGGYALVAAGRAYNDRGEDYIDPAAEMDAMDYFEEFAMPS